MRKELTLSLDGEPVSARTEPGIVLTVSEPPALMMVNSLQEIFWRALSYGLVGLSPGEALPSSQQKQTLLLPMPAKYVAFFYFVKMIYMLLQALQIKPKIWLINFLK